MHILQIYLYIGCIFASFSFYMFTKLTDHPKVKHIIQEIKQSMTTSVIVLLMLVILWPIFVAAIFMKN